MTFDLVLGYKAGMRGTRGIFNCFRSSEELGGNFGSRRAKMEIFRAYKLILIFGERVEWAW